MAWKRLQYTADADDQQPDVAGTDGILDVDVPANVDIGEDFVTETALVWVGGKLVPWGTVAWCWDRVAATDTIDILNPVVAGQIITVFYDSV